MIDSPRRPIVFVNTAGENSRTAKLTDAIVLAMRREQPANLRRWLADRGANVALDTARRAMSGRSWTHLPMTVNR